MRGDRHNLDDMMAPWSSPQGGATQRPEAPRARQERAGQRHESGRRGDTWRHTHIVTQSSRFALSAAMAAQANRSKHASATNMPPGYSSHRISLDAAIQRVFNPPLAINVAESVAVSFLPSSAQQAPVIVSQVLSKNRSGPSSICPQPHTRDAPGSRYAPRARRRRGCSPQTWRRSWELWQAGRATSKSCDQ